jgi:hypothetical protein
MSLLAISFSLVFDLHLYINVIIGNIMMMGYGSAESAGNVFGVNKHCLIMKRIRIFRNGCKLNIVLLPCDFWIHQKIQVVVGGVVIASV